MGEERLPNIRGAAKQIADYDDLDTILEDPARLFNQRGATRCAIDLREGDALDERAFEALVRAAAEIDPPKTGR